MNKWFHLVSTGGTFNGQNVNAIGPHAAQQIVYWALANYLQSHSNYSDVRWCTMAAARDIYGECSNEHRAVIAAWNACNIPTTPSPCPGSGGRIAAEQVNKSAGNQVNIYPNPASDFLTIQLPDQNSTTSLQLIDIKGNISKQWITQEPTSTFDVKGLHPGAYLLKGENSNGTFVHKLMINR